MTDIPPQNKQTNEETQGYLIEIFSSFQGEGGVVKGSCFGRRQIFIRFAGCDLRCRWCDSQKALNPVYPTCRIETTPGTWEFTTVNNPVAIDFVIEQVLSLKTADLHSIALTGGEPTYNEIFFTKMVDHLSALDIPLFLETAGYQPTRIKPVASLFTYACVDIKDRSAESVEGKRWEELVNDEIKSIVILNEQGVKVFAKYVVTEETLLEDARMVASKMNDLAVPIVIQPVTPVRGVKPISNTKLFHISEIFGENMPVELFGLSIQGHKLLSLL